MKKFFNSFCLLVVISAVHNAQAENLAPEKELSRQPDAIIATKSLSSLPRDILEVPLLKDLLSEDFVFYYRDSGADWLSFRGALARLAYEQKSDWPSRFLSWLMDGPAEIALWKGSEGRLNHFLVVIDQTGVKSLFEEIAKMMASQGATGDTQLSSMKIGERNVQVLKLSTEKTIYFTSEENRLFVFSEPNIQLPDSAHKRSFIERAKSFFGTNQEMGIFGPQLANSKHRLSLSAQYLSFNYQAFMSGLKAVRFEFTSGAWESQILMAGDAKPVESKFWNQMPRGAAFCAALPIDKKKVEGIVKLQSWLEKSDPVAVACWYPESKLYTPLIALHGDYSALLKNSSELEQAFKKLIGSREAFWKSSGEAEAAPILTWSASLPVNITKVGATGIAISREVGGRYGPYATAKTKSASKLKSKRFFRIELAALPNALLFSPDDQLVVKAISTLSGKFPSMSASFPAQAKTPSVIFAPEPLAKLLKQSILESLPTSQEAVFREAVAKHLFPNLDHFGKAPLQAASLGETLNANESSVQSSHWRKLVWAAHASH